jgi:hypothetical protein
MLQNSNIPPLWRSSNFDQNVGDNGAVAYPSPRISGARKGIGFMSGFERFHSDERGEITVDWVVLTFAVVGIGFGVIATVFGFIDAANSQSHGSVSADLN